MSILPNMQLFADPRYDAIHAKFNRKIIALFALIFIALIPLAFTESEILRALLEGFAFLSWVTYFLIMMKIRKEVKALEVLRISENE